jgi:hypothetical protein
MGWMIAIGVVLAILACVIWREVTLCARLLNAVLDRLPTGGQRIAEEYDLNTFRSQLGRIKEVLDSLPEVGSTLESMSSTLDSIDGKLESLGFSVGEIMSDVTEIAHRGS